MPKNTEIQYEVERDFATRFVAEQYITNGYGSHFHRNLEIYGVVDGEVLVSIAGDKRVLTNGQIAVVNCMEVHEYSVSKEAEIFYFHIRETSRDIIRKFKRFKKNAFYLDTKIFPARKKNLIKKYCPPQKNSENM